MDLPTQASDLIENIFETLEEQIGHKADVDLNSFILTVTLDDDCPAQGQFLLNFHGPTQQLWLSSPATGAHHFAWQAGGWSCTKSGLLLHNMLAQELSDATGANVNLEEASA